MKGHITAKSLADNGSPLINQKLFLHYFFSYPMQHHLGKLRIALHIRKEIAEKALSKSGWTWVSPKSFLTNRLENTKWLLDNYQEEVGHFIVKIRIVVSL
ncbi:hypothetical protein [Rossellomorea sp. DA94]|uniref:hypothetical protein n=1 Tax=Rossellomorea sp. DA94 TaxID=3038653 RepID=UPI00326066E7